MLVFQHVQSILHAQSERNRNSHDSRISERALREIYLKNFELMIKEINPDTIMVSYNK